MADLYSRLRKLEDRLYGAMQDGLWNVGAWSVELQTKAAETPGITDT